MILPVALGLIVAAIRAPHAGHAERRGHRGEGAAAADLVGAAVPRVRFAAAATRNGIASLDKCGCFAPTAAHASSTSFSVFIPVQLMGMANGNLSALRTTMIAC